MRENTELVDGSNTFELALKTGQSSNGTHSQRAVFDPGIETGMHT